jgi:hypothetical protein
MGLQTVGLNEILIITGDPSKIGDFPGATSVYDLSSFDLISMVKQFNEGLSYSGQRLGQRANFKIAAAFNPNVKYLDKAVLRMEKKIACGAQSFLTQPIYSVEQIEEVYEATKHLETPIFIGIMPLTSTRNAEFIHNEIPGIKLPDNVRRAMALAGDDPVKSRIEGVNIARELVVAAREKFKMRNILNENAVKNAFAVDMAMGGSTNTVLHMLAIANEAGVSFQLKDINRISQKVSHIAKISPSLSTVHMEDINRAGGVNAVMKEMTKRGDDVLIDNLTIGGETLLEKIADAEIKDKNIIHTIDNPYSKVGGLAILYGNLAEEGAVIVIDTSGQPMPGKQGGGGIQDRFTHIASMRLYRLVP